MTPTDDFPSEINCINADEATPKHQEMVDAALLEKFADRLNEEAMDVLEHQSIPGWE